MAMDDSESLKLSSDDQVRSKLKCLVLEPHKRKVLLKHLKRTKDDVQEAMSRLNKLQTLIDDQIKAVSATSTDDDNSKNNYDFNDTHLNFTALKTSTSKELVQTDPALSQSGEYCESIESFQWRYLTDKTPINSALYLYESLDDRIKSCLLCFSVFPDNCVINRRDLIYWWIGEGLVEEEHQSSSDLAGEADQSTTTGAKNSTADEIFNELTAKGFIEPVYRKRHPNVHRCRVNPLIRPALVMLAKKKGLFYQKFIGEDEDTRNSGGLLIKTHEPGSSSDNLTFQDSQVKTLFNVSEIDFLDIDGDWFSKLENVRVLHLGQWWRSCHDRIEEQTKFLRSVKKMKGLRCLSFQGFRNMNTYSCDFSFSDENDMRILDVREIRGLRRHPGLGKLRNLTHLDTTDCIHLIYLPEELASLTKLQVLKGFSIFCENIGRLTDLAQLQKLRKLSLIIRGSTSIATLEGLNCLVQFRALRSLTLDFYRCRIEGIITPNPNPNPFISTPDHHQKSLWNLEKLDLRGFPCRNMLLSWVNPTKQKNLRKLYLTRGPLCDLQCPMDMGEGQPPWNVEILRLRKLSMFQMNWATLKKLFPRLTYLENVECPKLSCFPRDRIGVWTK